MSEPIRVRPENLEASGLAVDRHVLDVETGHARADARIQTAQAGLVGLSAAAVEVKLAEWQATTQELTARLADHAEAFHASGVDFDATDIGNAQAIGAIGGQADATADGAD
jgi:hypothetical protein